MYKIVGADKKEYGPITADQMRQWMAEGRVNGQTIVWSEAGNNWKPLSSYAEFFGEKPPVLGAVIPPLQTGLSPQVPNYLTMSILSTICCCPAFGIVAIVFAAQVNGKLESGDHAGAVRASNNAKLWCWISFAVGILLNLASLLYFFVGGAFEALQHGFNP